MGERRNVFGTSLTMFGGFSSKNGPVSFAFPSTPQPPRTTKDWIVVLMDVKRLYMERQYRQCAARCIDLLNKADRSIHPVHKSFLSFYAAASYEAMGRAAHPYSSNKVSLLTSSLQYFIECDASLPHPINLPRLPKIEEDLSRPSSPDSAAKEESLATFSSPPIHTARNSMMAGINRMIDASLLDLDDPFIDNDGDDSDGKSTPPSTLMPNLWAIKDRSILVSSRIPKPTKSPTKQAQLKPSPLRISKGPGENASEVTVVPTKAFPMQKTRIASEWDSSPLSNTTSPDSVITVLPFSSKKASPETPNTSPPAPVPVTPQNKYVPDISIDSLSPVRAAQIVRSNRSIAFLRDQISTSIISLQAHIDQVQQLQAVRRARKLERATSMWNIDPTTDDSDQVEQAVEADPLLDESGNVFYKETKEQRIARLRAEGWETVGLRSPKSTWKGSRYYQDFCAMVMNELDLNA